MKKEEFEKRTRQVFHNIHLGHAEDSYIFKRLVSLLSEDYLRVKKGFLKGKICLDAGCGSAAPGVFAMLKMGARHVCCLDLDSSIYKTVKTKLAAYSGRYTVETGNVLNLKYADGYFDFVHCAGVLHHTRDKKSIFRGITELARVTKRGGMLYIMLKGKSGFLGEITNCLRNKYNEDKTFRKLIDSLSPQFFQDLMSFVLVNMKKKRDHFAGKMANETIQDLFDKDLILTIKDRIQAPTYLEVSWEELNKWLRGNGFSKIKRLTRYPRYTNLRRFLSPFYYHYRNKYSKLLYGEGMIQLVATKH